MRRLPPESSSDGRRAAPSTEERQVDKRLRDVGARCDRRKVRRLGWLPSLVELHENSEPLRGAQIGMQEHSLRPSPFNAEKHGSRRKPGALRYSVLEAIFAPNVKPHVSDLLTDPGTGAARVVRETPAGHGDCCSPPPSEQLDSRMDPPRRRASRIREGPAASEQRDRAGVASQSLPLIPHTPSCEGLANCEPILPGNDSHHAAAGRIIS